MSDATRPLSEPHPWGDLTPHQVLDRLVYELYTPVSALGADLDRLSTGAFEDDELLLMLDQMRESVNALGRLVVTLKRYSKEVQDEGSSEELPPV